MALCKSALVYLAINLAEVRVGAETEVGIRDIVKVWEEVPLSLVEALGAAPASSSPLPGGGFQQELRWTRDPAIAIGEEEF